MKKLLFGFFIFWAAIACKPSAERDDAKYLGTWKGYPSPCGSYNGVKITLNGRNDFPYDATMFNYSCTTKLIYPMSVYPLKISGNQLIGETMVGGTLPTFYIINADNTFRFGDISGLTKNHTK